MLSYVLKRKIENKFVIKMREYLDSKWTLFGILLLALISNVFSMEIPVFYIYTILIALVCLFCDDLLPLLPVACAGYMTFSKPNNPLSKDQTSIFIKPVGKINMIIIGVLIAIFVITRLVFDIINHKERLKVPKLLIGYVALGISYIFAGLFSEEYEFRSSFFGLVEILTLSFCYFIFYFTVDWKKVNKDYFALLFTSLSVMISFEIIGMLIHSGFFSTTGDFDRGLLFTGWGINNNVGGQACICLPAAFYFSCTKKNGWIFTLLGTFNYLCLLCTQSRASMLCGSFFYLCCLVIVMIKSINRKANIIVYISLLLSITAFAFIFKTKIEELFSSVIDKGLDDNGRFEIYEIGFNQFKESWVLGKGWYCSGTFQWGVYDPDDFLPPRYHNTIIQLIASGGIVMLVAYIYHRFETLKLFFKNFSLEKLFMGLCIGGLLSTSLLDCHFFNLGPGFLYSALLLLMEISEHNNLVKVNN